MGYGTKGWATAAIWMEKHECYNSYVNDDLLPKDSTWLKILDLLQCCTTTPVSVPSSCVRYHT